MTPSGNQAFYVLLGNYERKHDLKFRNELLIFAEYLYNGIEKLNRAEQIKFLSEKKDYAITIYRGYNKSSAQIDTHCGLQEEGSSVTHFGLVSSVISFSSKEEIAQRFLKFNENGFIIQTILNADILNNYCIADISWISTEDECEYLWVRKNKYNLDLTTDNTTFCQFADNSSNNYNSQVFNVEFSCKTPPKGFVC